MILLGLLLMVGALALSSAVIWANQDVFEKPAGTFRVLLLGDSLLASWALS